MQTWLDEIRAHNNGATAVAVTPPSHTVAFAASVPPPAPEPARVCFGQVQSVDNPGVSFKTAAALCGKPQRSGSVTDRLTYDKELVTCADCAQKLLGAYQAIAPRAAVPEDAVPVREPGGSGDLPALRPASFLPANFSHADFLDALLDVQALGQKLVHLRAELAAVEVLLAAAQERERVRQTGIQAAPGF
jgi:hypothetical protein